MADRIGGARVLEKVNLGSGIKCYAFEKNNKRVVAIWKYEDVGRESSILMRLSEKSFKSYNIVGGEYRPIQEKNGVRFKLTESPFYIETDMEYKELVRILSSADISGFGSPFSVSTTVLGTNKFSVNIKNRTNKPINGKMQILSNEKIVAEDTKIVFNGVKNEDIKHIIFTTLNPIALNDLKFKVKTVLDDGETFDVSEFNLKAMICKKSKSPVKIDGDLSEWQGIEPNTLTIKNVFKVDDKLWKDTDNNIFANVYTTWDNDYFYVGVEVNKEKFFQEAKEPYMTWIGDGLQIAFDPLKNSNPEMRSYGDDDFEYGIALTKKGEEVYRYVASSVFYDGFNKPIGVIREGEVNSKIVKGNGKVVYEIAFSKQSISPFKIEQGNSMKWDLIVNLNNGEGRMGWLEITPGIGQIKAPGLFFDIVLTE
jgi:hypothetical protein